MDGKLRNMTAIYLKRGNQILLLYRQGSRVADNLWVGSAGGHFEAFELNDARACILRELQEELQITESQLENFSLRYITMRNSKGEVRQNYYFFADLKEDIKDDFTSNEGILKWFDSSELSGLEMPISARFVLKHYFETGITNNFLYGGIADGEKVVFIKMEQ